MSGQKYLTRNEFETFAKNIERRLSAKSILQAPAEIDWDYRIPDDIPLIFGEDEILTIQATGNNAYITTQFNGGGGLHFNADSADPITFWDLITSGNPDFSLHGWITAGSALRSANLTVNDTYDEFLIGVENNANIKGVSINLPESTQTFKVRQNSDYIQMRCSTTDSYVEWSDGSLILQSLEGGQGAEIIIAGSSPALWIQHNTTEHVNAGRLDFTEDSYAFGVASGYGFRIKMDGVDNALLFQTGNQTTVKTAIRIDRDTCSLTRGGGGLDGTYGIADYFANSGYIDEYRHKIETSHSSTAGSNKFALSLCDGGATTFVKVLEIIGTEVFLPSIATNDAGDYALKYDATDGIVYDTSDRRQKSQIVDLDLGLKEILSLVPKRYNYQSAIQKNDGSGWRLSGSGHSTFGLIAQDVEEVIPDAVTVPQDPVKNLYAVKHEKIIPVLINAIKELHREIEDLKATIH